MELKSPMLASAYDRDAQRFPVLGSPKIDGIRAHIVNGIVYSRSGKPIRNKHIQRTLGCDRFNGFDGELCFGRMNAPDVYNKTSKGVMSVNGSEEFGDLDFDFHVFDCYLDPDLPHRARMGHVRREVLPLAYPSPLYVPMIKFIDQVIISNLEELDQYEADCLAQGFEGIMLRDPELGYKFGRSTAKEGRLLKVKRFAHSEARIVGFEELMHNTNEAVESELGRTKRSTAKDGMVPGGMLGAYIVEHPDYAKQFNVSCGSMDNDERKARCASRFRDFGKLCRFKYLPHGTKDVPRHPLFDGFRDPDDLS